MNFGRFLEVDSLEINIAATDRVQLPTFHRQIRWNSWIPVMELDFVDQQLCVLTNAHTVSIIQMALERRNRRISQSTKIIEKR